MTNSLTIQAGDALRFQLLFEEPRDSETAATATRGWLGASVDGAVVWPFGGVGTPTWPWVELLEHLARSWKYLLLEAGGDPVGIGVDADALLDRAELRWRSKSGRSKSEAEIDAEDAALRGYLRSHDLAAAFRGASAPSLFVVRIGERARLIGGGARTWHPWAEVETALRSLGDTVSARLVDVEDPRAKSARAAWRTRATLDDVSRVSVAIAWPPARAEALLASAPSDNDDFKMAAKSIASNPIAIAARMLSPTIDVACAVDLLTPLTRAKARSAPRLHALREQSKTLVLSGEPHEQGNEAARWIRTELALGDGRVDVDELLSELGVEIIAVKGHPSVDALCAWGPRTGPVIVVSERGQHARGDRGRRASLAHELAHLVFDLGLTLPIAEAKAPRAPAWIEQRANAFAAELLIPGAIAGPALAGSRTAANAEQAVNALCRQFDASRAVVAWQALNSNVPLRPVVEKTLRNTARKMVESDWLRGSSIARVVRSDSE